MHVNPYEKRYMILTGAMMVLFAGALIAASLAFGIQLPQPEMLVDARTVATSDETPFGLPEEERVREVADMQYEAWVLSKAWGFSPATISVPAGSTVTFYVTSQDVIHGFKLQETNINMMVIPGQVSKLTYTFDNAGEYLILCHEYCGIGHHAMFGKVVVE